MQVGYSDNPIFPAPPEPFALIVGSAAQVAPPAVMEQALRQMGLRPEQLAPGRPATAGGNPLVDAPLFRIRFASLSALVGRASGEALDLADPRDPSISLLAATLPGDWRAGGYCWALILESEGATDGAARVARIREFFKMFVLLVDLFDASHIFWSPARLWSDAPQLRASVAEMLASGMPPVLHLIAYRHRETGIGAVVRTRGLALFGGQEIEARMPRGWTVAEMIKRLARLSLDIISHGPVLEQRRVRGLGPGEWASLSPSSDGPSERSTLLVEFGSDL